MSTADENGSVVVVIDARVGMKLSYPAQAVIVHVQLPGAARADQLVTSRAQSLYTVDFNADSFTGFIDSVLAAKRPALVIAASERSAEAAAQAVARLAANGIPVRLSLAGQAADS